MITVKQLIDSPSNVAGLDFIKELRAEYPSISEVKDTCGRVDMLVDAYKGLMVAIDMGQRQGKEVGGLAGALDIVSTNLLSEQHRLIGLLRS